MRFKVDENLPRDACDLLNRAGHDAISVGQQGWAAPMMRGSTGYARTSSARSSLDMDFGNVQAYDPKSSSGVIVLRLARQDRARVLDAVTSVLPVLEREPLDKRLWMVEGDKIRIRA